MGHPQLLDVGALWQSLPPEALHLTDERYQLPSGLAVGAIGTGVEALREMQPRRRAWSNVATPMEVGTPSPRSPSTPCASGTTSSLTP